MVLLYGRQRNNCPNEPRNELFSADSLGYRSDEFIFTLRTMLLLLYHLKNSDHVNHRKYFFLFFLQ